MAFGDLKIWPAITVPCSVNACGRVPRPPRLDFDIAICDVKQAASSPVSWNIKSSGNRLRLRLTASLKRKVGTPYRAARSRSKITLLPRTITIRVVMSTVVYAIISFFIFSLPLANSSLTKGQYLYNSLLTLTFQLFWCPFLKPQLAPAEETIRLGPGCRLPFGF